MIKIKQVSIMGESDPNKLEIMINSFIQKNIGIFLSYEIFPIFHTKEQWFTSVVYVIDKDDLNIVRN